MKKLISFCFLTFFISIFPASRPAQAKTLVNVVASIPDFFFHGVTAVTDKTEYVSGKVAYGFMEIDTYADDAVTYFHNLAHPTSAAVAAKAQAKAAKKAAKKAAAKKS